MLVLVFYWSTEIRSNCISWRRTSSIGTVMERIPVYLYVLVRIVVVVVPLYGPWSSSGGCPLAPSKSIAKENCNAPVVGSDILRFLTCWQIPVPLLYWWRNQLQRTCRFIIIREVFGNFSDMKVPNWSTVPVQGRLTVKILSYRLPPKVTVKKGETVYRQKVTVMLRYRRKSTIEIWFTVYRQNLTVNSHTV